MTDSKMALLELVQKSDDGNFLRELLQFSLQRLMSFEVEGLCGAGPHERSEARVNQRNGYRDRIFETRLGTPICASPSCAMAATSRPSWRPARRPSGRWSR